MKILQTADYVSDADMRKLSPFEREALYNGFDCTITLEVFEALVAEMRGDNYTAQTYARSLAMRGPILDMSARGIRIDQRKRAYLLEEFRDEHSRLERQLGRIFLDGIGRTYNYRSTKDMIELFYTVLGHKPIRKRNARGQFTPTVNRDAIERLSINFFAAPICSHMLALRDLDKRISFLKTGIDADGRMRANFNIAGTVTGRLSSSMSEFGTGTNLQNVDRRLRTIFLPDDGMKFFNMDLEQGDSRNMGAMMWNVFYDDEGPDFAGSYLDICESADLHTTVTKMVWPDLEWGDDPKGWRAIAEQPFYRQDSYRQTSKKLGHGTNYRGTPPTMAMHSKMPQNIISDFQSSYFRAFPVIPEYHKWIEQELQSYGFLTNLHGRRRHFFSRVTEPKTINEAVAYPSQSDTADAIITAMLNIWDKYKTPDVQLLCQVHDSLLYQIPEALENELVPEMLETAKDILILKGGREFCVPNEAKTGWNWGDADDKNPRDKNEFGLRKYKGADDRKPTARMTF